MRVRSVLMIPFVLIMAACQAPEKADPAPPVSRVVAGYFTEWGAYGRGYRVKNLVSSGAAGRLTHLLYAFGKVDGGRCGVGDPYAAYEKPIAATDSVDGAADAPTAPLRGNFGQLKKLKATHPGLKILWSFGGWTWSAGFTQAARDPAAFAKSCHDLVTDPRWAGVFDGIDIDWEYPNACGLQCDTSGREALAKVLAALRTAFGAGTPVTAAVPGDLKKLQAVDYSAAAAQATWLSAMTYDYFGAGTADKQTAPHSPLTGYPGIPRPGATTDATVTQLLNQGVPPAKLLFGVGFYGRGWTGVRSPAPGGRATGPAPGTYEKGMEDYRVLAGRCPPTGTVGGTAYARCGVQWWSYDTPDTIRGKVNYARERGLAGVFAWELSGDTPDGRLLTALAG
ncbi:MULTISPECIES: glycoside hydrolase family 18 protein [unclassified Actinoplanes]|uniref:glycoside hydrolase family 18 protein n=1 Tax=unclassified Actinoplanes TaxID=2626549 RepID=UPI001E354335|nr:MULTISPECIES: glycoside hydrolase family 18 protein [unclassified Actinoplanes]